MRRRARDTKRCVRRIAGSKSAQEFAVSRPRKFFPKSKNKFSFVGYLNHKENKCEKVLTLSRVIFRGYEIEATGLWSLIHYSTFQSSELLFPDALIAKSLISLRNILDSASLSKSLSSGTKKDLAGNASKLNHFHPLNVGNLSQFLFFAKHAATVCLWRNNPHPSL